MEGKCNQDLCELNYDIGMDSQCIPVVGQGVLLALSAESKLLLVNLMDWYGEKAFASSVAIYQVPGDMLICSSKDTTSGTAAAIGATTWLSL